MAKYLLSNGIVIDSEKQVLTINGQEISVRAKVFQLLMFFLNKQGELLSKDEIISSVWDGRAVSEAVLTTTIRELRDVLGDDAKEPKIIETIHKRGYVFLLSYEEVSSTQRISKPPKQKNNFRDKISQLALRDRMFLIGLVMIAIVSVRAIILPQISLENRPLEIREVEDKAIVVLPLGNRTQDNEFNWFAKDFSEQLTYSLASSSNLFVSSAQAANRVSNAAKPHSEIAQQLDVDYIVDGFVIGDQAELQLTIKLIRTGDEAQLWERSYKRPMTLSAVDDLQTEISNEIISILSLKPVEPVAQNNSHPSSFAIYEKYVRAKQILETRDREKILEAMQLLEDVTTDDPEFALGRAQMAMAYTFAINYAGQPREVLLPKAEEQVLLALELSPRSAEVLIAAASISIWSHDFESGLAYINQAIEIEPKSAIAHYRKGHILASMGSSEEGLKSLRKSLVYDQASPIVLNNITFVELFTGDGRAALDAALVNIRANPDTAVAHEPLGEVYLQTGNYLEAHKYLSSGIKLNPKNAGTQMGLGHLYWTIGDHAKITSEEQFGPFVYAAKLYVSGEDDEAIILSGSARGHNFRSIGYFDLLYWDRQYEAAYNEAVRRAEQISLLNPDSAFTRYSGDAIPTLVLLEMFEHPDATTLREKLTDHFEGTQPEDFALLEDLFGGMSWHLFNDQPSEAMAWLQEGQRRGLIFRSILYDPLFDSVRSDPVYVDYVEQMEKTAAEIRKQL